jgi:hypothetical protein
VRLNLLPSSFGGRDLNSVNFASLQSRKSKSRNPNEVKAKIPPNSVLVAGTQNLRALFNLEVTSSSLLLFGLHDVQFYSIDI